MVSENSYLFTCSDAAELNLRGSRLGDGTGTRLISMSSSTASDKEWSLSLDNCIIDASGSDTRSLVVCYGYRKQLRIRNCTFIGRSEEHTSELQSLMRTSYAVFFLKKKITKTSTKSEHSSTM